jgi:hypothetical protein
MKKILLLVLCLFVISCASTLTVRDTTGLESVNVVDNAVRSMSITLAGLFNNAHKFIIEDVVATSNGRVGVVSVYVYDVYSKKIGTLVFITSCKKEKDKIKCDVIKTWKDVK